jgi:DNA-binding transcriptional ArsR family regulator
MGRGFGGTVGAALVLGVLWLPVAWADASTDAGEPPQTDVQTVYAIWDALDDLADSALDGAQDLFNVVPEPARDHAAQVDDRIEQFQRTKDSYDERGVGDWDDQLGRDARDLQPEDQSLPMPSLPTPPPAPSDPRAPDSPEVERVRDTADDLLRTVRGEKKEESPGTSRDVEPTAILAPLLRMLDEGARLATEAAAQTAAKVTGLMLVLLGLLGFFGAAGATGASPLATLGLIAKQASSPEGAAILGAFAVASAALLPRFRKWWLPLLAPLLSRITPDRIMEHEARRHIFEIVRAESGISLHGIVAKLGLSRNAVAYHLAVFESERAIVSVKDGKYRRYFLTGGKYVNGAKDVVATLRNAKTLRVVQFVLGHPGSIQKELCAAVATSPSATNWHITRLEKVNLIRKSRVENTVRYFTGEAMVKYDRAEFGLSREPEATGPVVSAAPSGGAPVAFTLAA